MCQYDMPWCVVILNYNILFHILYIHIFQWDFEEENQQMVTSKSQNLRLLHHCHPDCCRKIGTEDGLYYIY